MPRVRFLFSVPARHHRSTSITDLVVPRRGEEISEITQAISLPKSLIFIDNTKKNEKLLETLV
jgi:hypothetical protein